MDEQLIAIPGYEVVKKIGEGGSGRVYLGYRIIGGRPSSVPLALKVFKLDGLHPNIQAERERRDLRQIVMNEFTQLAYINHPNIIRMYMPEECGETFVVPMEYMNSKTLEDYIGELNGKQLDLAIKSIRNGLMHLHSKGLVLRDLKLNNVFVHVDDASKTSSIKIGDLETITSVDQLVQGNRRTVGSDKYLAPELIRGEPATRESDLFAFGACIYYLVSGERPMDDSPIKKLAESPEKEYLRRLMLMYYRLGCLNMKNMVRAGNKVCGATDFTLRFPLLLSYDPKERNTGYLDQLKKAGRFILRQMGFSYNKIEEKDTENFPKKSI